MQSQTADTNQLIFLHLELNLCSHTSKVKVLENLTHLGFSWLMLFGYLLQGSESK